MDKKICNSCKRGLPATPEYFYKCAGGRHGLRSSCKECEYQTKREYYLRVVKPKISQKVIEKRKNRVCPQCGKVFNAKLSTGYGQIYCSSVCKNKYSRPKKKEYMKSNREYFNKLRRIKQRKREKEDLMFKLNRNISAAVRGSLGGNKNFIKLEKCLGYKIKDLIKHIESKFQPEMNWGNHGIYGWHIDHIIPVSLWKFEKPEDREFKQCWALCNLQPLWARENLEKGSKWVA